MKNKGNIFDTFDRLIRNREGVTFEQFLFMVFLYAKITDGITWGWFWVFLPLTFQYFVFLLALLREGYKVAKMTKEELKQKEKLKKDTAEFIDVVKKGEK
jgi:hypothetical protein